MPINTTDQLQLILDYLNAVESKDYDKISSLISDDFENYVLPRSFKPPGQSEEESSGKEKPRFRDEYLEMLKKALPLFRDMRVIVEEVTEEPGKIVLHVRTLTYFPSILYLSSAS